MFTVRVFLRQKIEDPKHSMPKSFCNQNTFSESIYLYIHAQGTQTRSISLYFSIGSHLKNAFFYVRTDER